MTDSMHALLQHIIHTRHDAQAQYTALIQLYDLLHRHKHPQTLLTTLLHPIYEYDGKTAQHMVAYIVQHLAPAFANYHEIQWYVCRLVAFGCHHSMRFQQECGQLHAWNTIQSIRSAFPTSDRILEASLDAYAALLSRNEYHQLQMTTATAIVKDMLDSMATHGVHREFYHRQIVIKSLDVLLAMFSSSRLVSTFLSSEKTAMKIVTHMLQEFGCFQSDTEALKIWLRMGGLLMHHFPSTITILFTPSVANQMPSPWFVTVLDPYALEQYDLVLLVLGLLMQFVAAPSSVSAQMQALLLPVFVTHGLFAKICGILSHWSTSLHPTTTNHDTTTSLDDRKRQHTDTIVMEIVRLLRQLSSRSDQLVHIFLPPVSIPRKSIRPISSSSSKSASSSSSSSSASSTSSSSWITVLASILSTVSPPSTPQHQCLVIEICVLLRHLASAAALHASLRAQSFLRTLQSTWKTGNYHEIPLLDHVSTDPDVLLARELKQTIATLVPIGASAASSSAKTSRSSKTPSSSANASSLRRKPSKQLSRPRLSTVSSNDPVLLKRPSVANLARVLSRSHLS